MKTVYELNSADIEAAIKSYYERRNGVSVKAVKLKSDYGGDTVTTITARVEWEGSFEGERDDEDE
jgi:hypothetical protein